MRLTLFKGILGGTGGPRWGVHDRGAGLLGPRRRAAAGPKSGYDGGAQSSP